ncbi:hypothetical protein [Paractinoplanes hotanensis]|uniref:UspA domain-containing protein n=1 Tax=Paractinoplanes hotanensis TaxID=2906497 RepID=A0ABT0YFM6_9ACTN|nr:hypothetical protein [Actinoplanes hotanensis]MCM4084839.1 hypothetical protein [Actinoplanes hotanensis]
MIWTGYEPNVSHGYGVRGCELIMVNAIPHAVPSSRIEVVDGLRVHRHLVDEAPAAALIRASNDAAAAVVVGRHAYSGDVMPLLGSVTRAVCARLTARSSWSADPKSATAPARGRSALPRPGFAQSYGTRGKAKGE